MRYNSNKLNINMLVCSLFTVLALILMPKCVFADGTDYKLFSTIKNVNYNKVWTIKMSSKLDGSTVNNDNVLVRDSLKRKINVNVHLGSKDSEIIVEPPKDGYDIGGTYTLEVTKNVLSSRGYRMPNNIRFVFTIEDLPVVDFCKIDHLPIIEGHSFGVYMNAKTNRDVRYNVFIYDVQRNTYKSITGGYSVPINGKMPFYVKYKDGLKPGVYKLKAYIKRADVKGNKYDSKTKVYYDNLYDLEFRCNKASKNLISIDGGVKLLGNNYKSIEDGYSIRIGDTITIRGMDNISGMSGNYKYKLQAYNLSNIKDIRGLTNYMDKPSWTPQEAGEYILEVWIKSYKETENDTDTKENKTSEVTSARYDAKVFVHIKVRNEEIRYVKYDMTLNEFIEKQGQRGWGEQWVNGGFRKANRTLVEYYINPKNFINDEYGKYQFLKLNYVAGLTVDDLNMFLEGQGVLEGKGAAFLEAAKKNNVNPAYLIAHAILETGGGKSKLAKGVLVSSVDGKPVKPRVTYNMYGIKAYDSNPIKYASEYAYKQGWFTPEKAIIGGQTYIAKNYINNKKLKQDTLYKIRWSPNDITHEYATDVRWAYKQIKYLKELLDKSKRAFLIFEIPVFKKDN
ncbi:beta-N-acetylglucosaminidase precursor [Clostridium tepidiprofundi DSM 19306]|uniref:Beta-N-acetylglucosaminidase n=1 Tax=Clostridium tepidiprofundi DSM 19306 TaxID=1121338 RepID=A0A151B2T1_9CLOT|nr:N-acetylglucosaminidase [Clostridium tepidiprofundi]KYH34224.1 beta-N-acetylglucosaminidase precursor [Clostridium tepidiprofundi DSM 19306]